MFWPSSRGGSEFVMKCSVQLFVFVVFEEVVQVLILLVDALLQIFVQVGGLGQSRLSFVLSRPRESSL